MLGRALGLGGPVLGCWAGLCRCHAKYVALPGKSEKITRSHERNATQNNTQQSAPPS